MQDHNLSTGQGTSHGSQSVGQSNSGTSSSPQTQASWPPPSETMQAVATIVDRHVESDPLQEIAASIERDKQRRARWPSDLRRAMSELAKLFPTMRGVPGTDPWNVDLLISWMNGGAPTSGSWCAAMFLLGVWNPTTAWNTCGLKARKGKDRFDLFRAMQVWDYHHIAAFQEWVANPFWP